MATHEDIALFISALDFLGEGYCEGRYKGDRWGVTVTGKPGAKVRKVYGERMSGGDHISCNLYITSRGGILKPCEMPEEKILHFLIWFEPLRMR